MKEFLAISVFSIAVCSVAEAAWSGTTVELRSQDVSVQEAVASEAGPHFVMDINVPDGVSAERLVGAILEFVVDADTRVDTTWVEDADTLRAVVHSTPVPMVEVYALTSSRSALDRENWNEAMSFPVPVGVGSDKMVRIDITRLVKYLIEHPSENHGIVVGSLTGERFGIFALQEYFGAGVVARIRYVY